MRVVLVGAQDGNGIVALFIKMFHNGVVCVALQLHGKELQAKQGCVRTKTFL